MGARVIESEFDIINYEAGVSNDVLGAECQSCARLLLWKFFPKDSSRKTGYGPQCYWCLSQPRLSIKEHTARLQEMNYNSAGTRRQRSVDQEFFHQDRTGRPMDCSLFLQKLHHLYPALYITQGGILGDIALYATSGTAKPEWEGRTFAYIGYATLGLMPEFSKYEFDRARDIMLRASHIGWRSILLRFIEKKILTEAQVLAEFGPPSGGENSIWYKKLHQYRNQN